MNIQEILKYAVDKGASDIHLSAGVEPMIRFDGDLEVIPKMEKLSDAEVTQLVKDVIPKEDFDKLETEFEIDLAIDVSDICRFRVNVFFQVDGLAVAFRPIPSEIRTLEDLGMPPILKKLCDLPNGLILLTGPTGCGKSTTLAAMLDYINTTKPVHILTLEDPIEFIQKGKKALIQQREIHHNTASFQNALRAALREDPDVILVGEMRDIETIRLALTAAETGHLVLATLHTSSAPKTVNRVVDVFPSGEKMLIRTLLAESLQAVISQRLVKRKGGGRVAAHEVMLCTVAIRNLIREDKIEQMMSVMQTAQNVGMRTMEHTLKELIVTGVIDSSSIE